MSAEDELRSLVRLLWRGGGDRPTSGRGPRPKFTVDEVVDAAIALADARGLYALSIRTLAAELGVGPMTLYTYVPSREVLVALMVDRVATPGPAGGGDVFDAIGRIARAIRDELIAHPWLLDAPAWRQVLGPRRLARYQRQLELIEPLPLTDLERDALVSMVVSFATGSAREAVAVGSEARSSGMTDAQWWDIVGPELAAVMPVDGFELAGRVGTAVGEHYQAAGDPAEAFEFGLARIVSGVRELVADR